MSRARACGLLATSGSLGGHQDEAAARICHSNGFDDLGRDDRPARTCASPDLRSELPVCLQIYQGMVDYYFECRYQTMAQCAASASGRAAQCVVNPYYGGPKAGRSKRQKRPQPY
jgi:hypothetical protein